MIRKLLEWLFSIEPLDKNDQPGGSSIFMYVPDRKPSQSYTFIGPSGAGCSVAGCSFEEAKKIAEKTLINKW